MYPTVLDDSTSALTGRGAWGIVTENKHRTVFIVSEIQNTVVSYLDCLSEYGSDYAIRKAIGDGTLFHVGRGLYSNVPFPGFLAISMARHPAAIVCLDSAFFYHGLTDTVPDALHLATSRSAKRIADPAVRQHFVPQEILHVGESSMERNGAKVRIYDLERIAIDVVRMRPRLPYELCKEVILALRGRSRDMYPARIADYLEHFPRRDSILDAIEKEIF